MQLPIIVFIDVAIITLAFLYVLIDIISILRQPLIHFDHDLSETSFQTLPPTSSLQHHRQSTPITMSEPTFSVLLQQNIITPAPAPAIVFGSPNDGYQSSESSYSQGSYTEEEYQMGLDYWRRSGHSESSYVFNPDGTWCLSPAIVEQIAVIEKLDLDGSERDSEVDYLLYLIEEEIDSSSPRESAIDLADAIEEGRFNPWDNRPTGLTSKDRVMLWRAMNPEIFVSYSSDPAPIIGEPEADCLPCACDQSDPEVLCFGDICAVVKEGSSVNQAARAENLFNARIKNDEMAILVAERDRAAGCVAGRDDGYVVEADQMETLVDEDVAEGDGGVRR